MPDHPDPLAQPPSSTAPDGQPQAPPETPSDSFSLLVKNPTDRPGSEPFTLQIVIKATVLELKQRLAQSYPGSPPVPAQRLIYAGKLLDDRHSLESVMGAVDRAAQHTIHLVVSNMHAAGASAMGPRAPSLPTRTAPTVLNPNPQPRNSNTGTAGPRPPQPPMPPYMLPGQLALPYMGALPQYPHNVYQGMQQAQNVDPATGYPMPYPMYPFPPPPSDNPNAAQNATPGTAPAPFAPVDPSAYAAHLQSMERIIADTLAANARATAATDAANGQAQREGADAAHNAQAVQAAAAQAAAAAAAMHAHAHVQAMANYDAGLRAQAGNNDQQAMQFLQQGQQGRQGQGAGFGFAIGRGNVPPPGAHHRQNQNGDGQPRVRQFVFQFEINWSLISKLILLVYLLGQEGSPRRVYTLMILALGIYLWQTNRLGFLRRVAGVAVPNPAQLFETLFPQQNPLENSEPGADGARDSGGEPRPRRRMHRFGRFAVIMSFIYSFFYGFVCSLLPAWRPQPLPRIEELMNPQENQEGEERAAAAGSQRQGDNGNNHEHAD